MKVEWYSDPSRNASLEQAQLFNYKPLENGLLKVGYSSDAEWLKITVENPAQITNDLLVGFSKKITDSITFYYKENQEWKTMLSGRVFLCIYGFDNECRR